MISSHNPKTRRMARIGIGVFLLLHGFLHILFRHHPAYEFSNMYSNVLIFGGSILGIVYLVLEWSEKAGGST